MINDNEKQHLAVKRLNGLFLKKTGHSGECCLNCLKLFVNKLSFQKQKKNKKKNVSLFHNQNPNQFHNQ